MLWGKKNGALHAFLSNPVVKTALCVPSSQTRALRLARLAQAAFCGFLHRQVFMLFYSVLFVRKSLRTAHT